MSKNIIRVLCLAIENDKPESEMLKRLHGSISSFGSIEITIVIEAGSKYKSLYQESGIEVLELTASGRFSLNYISNVIRLIKKKKIDIVHSFSKKNLSNALFALTYLKFSDHQDIPTSLAYRGIEGNLSLVDPGSWLTYFHPRLDKIVCVSHSINNYLCSYKTLNDKTITVHKGHDTNWYESINLPTKTMLGLKEDDFLLSCVCNFRPRKGLSVLLEALVLLPDNVKLILVGKVNHLHLEKQLSELSLGGRVYSLGYQEDAWKYAASSDLFVMPSLRREGLPKSVIEAMASGTASVVSRVGGMPEIVEHGTSGFIVESGDVKGLAKAIENYILKPSLLEKHSKAAKVRIKERFDLNQTVEKYREIYENLAH